MFWLGSFSKPTKESGGTERLLESRTSVVKGRHMTWAASDVLPNCPVTEVLEAARDANLAASASIGAARPHDKRPRVLVVEDEGLPAIELATELIDAGFDVIGPAGSFAQALSLLGQDHHGCDAAVLDVNLGRETSEPIARILLSSGVPFVTVSGYAREQVPSSFGRLTFLAKPLRHGLLVETLNRLLQEARADSREYPSRVVQQSSAPDLFSLEVQARSHHG